MIKMIKQALLNPILLIIAAAASLAACGNVASPPSAANVLGGTIVEVNLQDGTRCAVWDGFKAGGISCDWK